MPPAKLTHTERCSKFKHDAAKALRTNATECERRLWSLLRGKKMAQLRFRRQQPIGPYIVDFFCPAAKLVIELDGDQHSRAEDRARDAARTNWLETRGYRVLRVTNREFLEHREAVLEGIWRVAQDRGPRHPEPPNGGSTLPQGGNYHLDIARLNP